MSEEVERDMMMAEDPYQAVVGDGEGAGEDAES